VDAIVWGFVLRLGQVALDAALPIVVGVVTAGVLRRMVGPAGTRRVFGRGWKGLVRGWVAGKLLPVCSLGVIPVSREVRRAGVPGGTVLAFTLAAPLLNPISLLYGLTLAEPKVILAFLVASLILSTAAGVLWDRLFAPSGAAEDEAKRAALADAEPLPAHGPKRLLAVLVTAGRELVSRDVRFFAVGLIGSAAVAAVVPFGALQHTMKHADPTSPLLMAAVAVPAYSTPLPGMMRVGLMFDHGNSIGAAFGLFVLGIGLSLGTLAYLGSDFGWRRVGPWAACYLGVVLGLGYLAQPLLYDSRKVEIDHTHAFDDFSNPFPSGSAGPAAVRARLAEKFGPLGRPAVAALLLLVVVGLTARRLDRGGRLEAWLTAPPAAATDRRWDVAVPGFVLSLITLAGLVAFSVIGAFVYYPDREQCKAQMAAVYANAAVAVRTGHPDEAMRELEQWDLLVRKLEVGEAIRRFGVTAEQSRAAETLREAIEEVRDQLLASDQPAAARSFSDGVESAYRQCKSAYGR
jgi:hypothetical protein